MGRTPLRSLDLFSGIGGLSIALTGIASPMLYCDIDPAAQAVLADCMKRQLLPQAPICPDVRQLTPSWLRAHTGKQPPEAIAAGFPCVGFSLVGQRRGYSDEQSGLFREILRLLDEHRSIQYLFLENVAQFVHDGMPHLVSELHMKRKFSLTWACMSASDVGAPQLRRRWFCIAYRGQLPKPVAFKAAGYQPFTRRWAAEPQQRTACPGGPARRPLTRGQLHGVQQRLKLLGNSVVPDAARHAFMHLLDAAHRMGQGVGVNGQSAWPPHGVVHHGRVTELLPPTPLLVWPHKITLDPSLYRPAEGYQTKALLKPLRKKKVLRYWATPRAGLVTGCQVLTERTSHDLPSQIRWEVRTRDAERGCAMAAEFGEWLMGFPTGYTLAAG